MHNQVLKEGLQHAATPSEGGLLGICPIIDADGRITLDHLPRLPEQFRRRQSISIGDGFDRRQNGRIRTRPSPWSATCKMPTLRALT